MTLIFQLVCTVYFAVLLWTLHAVLSSPKPANRTLLLGTAVATAALVGLHVAWEAPLGKTHTNPPLDKFFFLLRFSGMVVVLQVLNPWLRRTFTRRAARQQVPAAGVNTLLAANAFLASKALYVLIYAYQVLTLWVPRIA